MCENVSVSTSSSPYHDTVCARTAILNNYSLQNATSSGNYTSLTIRRTQNGYTQWYLVTGKKN